MGYYQEWREHLKYRHLDEVAKMNDNVFYNLTFGINNNTKGYHGASYESDVAFMMIQDKRIEEKLIRVAKNHNYDITLDHSFDIYRFKKGYFVKSDYTEDMIKYMFESRGILNFTEIRTSWKKLYVKHIIENDIKLSTPYYVKYWTIREECMTQEEINLAEKFVLQFLSNIEKL